MTASRTRSRRAARQDRPQKTAPTLTRRSTLAEVASAVATALASAKIEAVLTGGACASLHSHGRYTSRDLDFVVVRSASGAQLDPAMAAAGFRRRGNYYAHPRTRYFVEFMPAPLAIGADTAIRAVVRTLAGRRVRLLSPTDSCRDRLAAFYHWSDRQSLSVAIEIALANRVRTRVIERWSADEGHAREFAEFAEALEARRRERSPRPTRSGGSRPSDVLGLAAAVIIGAALAAGCARGSDEREAGRRPGVGIGARPNVLLVTIDTFRADHLHAAGYARETTPVIDSLAAAGALFLQAISPAPQTAPSHASMLTGAYPPAHTVRSNGIFALPEEATTIAEILREAGYETGAFVGSFVLDRRFGFAQGFDAFGDSMHAAPGDVAGDAGERAHVWYGNIVERGFERRAGAVTDEALRWLAARDLASPFFLWVHYYDPHAPYDPPDEHDIFPKHDPTASYAQWEEQEGESPHEDAAEEESEARSKDAGSEDAGAARRREAAPDSARRATLREDMIALYDGELRYCDAQLGRLLAALQARGAASNTLVIVTSDHGESLGENEYDFRHGWYLFDDVLRVPLVMSVPNGKIRGGTPVRYQVELTQIFETIRQEARAGDGGRGPLTSLVELAVDAQYIKGNAIVRARAETTLAYSETFLRKQLVGGPPLFAVRSPRWKYIEPIQEPGRTRRWLYDLEADPGEARNLAKQGPTMTAIADSMSALLHKVRAASESEAVGGAHEIVPDEATIERLRSLGYIK